MKNLHLKKARKLLLVLAFVAFLFTPIYSMINTSGYIWEIDYDNCVCCGSCSEAAPEYIAVDGNGRPYFINGNIIAGSSIYLDYSPDEDPILEYAYYSCPFRDLAFKKDTY